jgi:hypothetical protein
MESSFLGRTSSSVVTIRAAGSKKAKYQNKLFKKMSGFIQFSQTITEIGHDKIRPNHARYHPITKLDAQPLVAQIVWQHTEQQGSDNEKRGGFDKGG